MNGPPFLLIYGFLAGAAILVCRALIRAGYTSRALPTPNMPAHLDPAEIAYLQDGPESVLDVALVRLRQSGAIKARLVRTYEARLHIEEDTPLRAYAERFNRALHAMHAQRSAGKDLSKPAFMRAFDLTSRQYNAVKNKLDAITAGEKERGPLRIADLRKRIVATEAKIAKELARKIVRRGKIHHLKRRLDRLRSLVASLESDEALHLCFGSRKLFKAQHHLEVNGFASHKEWQIAWHDARADERYVHALAALSIAWRRPAGANTSRLPAAARAHHRLARGPGCRRGVEIEGCGLRVLRRSVRRAGWPMGLAQQQRALAYQPRGIRKVAGDAIAFAAGFPALACARYERAMLLAARPEPHFRILMLDAHPYKRKRFALVCWWRPRREGRLHHWVLF